jgi:hypothetical protein
MDLLGAARVCKDAEQQDIPAWMMIAISQASHALPPVLSRSGSDGVTSR